MRAMVRKECVLIMKTDIIPSQEKSVELSIQDLRLCILPLRNNQPFQCGQKKLTKPNLFLEAQVFAGECTGGLNPLKSPQRYFQCFGLYCAEAAYKGICSHVLGTAVHAVCPATLCTRLVSFTCWVIGKVLGLRK